MTPPRPYRLPWAILIAASLTPVAGDGQTTDDGGLRATLRVSERIRVNDNRDLAVTPQGTTVLSETQLTFGLSQTSQHQDVSLTLGDTYRFGSGPGAPDSPRFQLPDLAVDYARRSRSARLDIKADLTTDDLRDSRISLDTSDPTDVITDNGFETRRTLSLGLETGMDGPVGTTITLFERDRQFEDTTEADLFDRTTRRAAVALTLRPDAVSEARLSYDHTQYTADDTPGTRRITDRIRLDLRRDLDPVTQITGGVGWTRIAETRRALSRDGPMTAGLTAELGVTRRVARGSASARLSRAIENTGPRSDLILTRSFVLPTGRLDLSAGLTDPARAGLQPVGSVRYRHDRLRQRLVIDATSRVVSGDDDSLQRSTRVGVNYTYELSELTQLAVSVSYARNDSAGGPVPVANRETAVATAGLWYRVTAGWVMQTGYTHRRRSEEGRGTARSNEVFVALTRDFSWRP